MMNHVSAEYFYRECLHLQKANQPPASELRKYFFLNNKQEYSNQKRLVKNNSWNPEHLYEIYLPNLQLLCKLHQLIRAEQLMLTLKDYVSLF